jgi:hypothetical protein
MTPELTKWIKAKCREHGVEVQKIEEYRQDDKVSVWHGYALEFRGEVTGKMIRAMGIPFSALGCADCRDYWPRDGEFEKYHRSIPGFGREALCARCYRQSFPDIELALASATNAEVAREALGLGSFGITGTAETERLTGVRVTPRDVVRVKATDPSKARAAELLEKYLNGAAGKLLDQGAIDDQPIFTAIPKTTTIDWADAPRQPPPGPLRALCSCGQEIVPGAKWHNSDWCGDCLRTLNYYGIGQPDIDARIAATKPEPDDRHECAWSTPSSDGEDWT